MTTEALRRKVSGAHSMTRSLTSRNSIGEGRVHLAYNLLLVSAQRAVESHIVKGR